MKASRSSRAELLETIVRVKQDDLLQNMQILRFKSENFVFDRWVKKSNDIIGDWFEEEKGKYAASDLEEERRLLAAVSDGNGNGNGGDFVGRGWGRGGGGIDAGEVRVHMAPYSDPGAGPPRAKVTRGSDSTDRGKRGSVLSSRVSLAATLRRHPTPPLRAPLRRTLSVAPSKGPSSKGPHLSTAPSRGPSSKGPGAWVTTFGAAATHGPASEDTRQLSPEAAAAARCDARLMLQRKSSHDIRTPLSVAPFDSLSGSPLAYQVNPKP